MTADELEALVAKATPGVWTQPYGPCDGDISAYATNGSHISDVCNDDVTLRDTDANLIVALVNNAPRLIEALRASEWQGIEIETAAWDWLETRFGTEADDPVDRVYDASEMVDAFHAGQAMRPLPAPPATEAPHD